MGRKRIYVDTSVIGGCLDAKFGTASRKLLEQARAGEVVLVISEITEIELAHASAEVRAVLDDLPAESIERIKVSNEAYRLAEQYIREGVIGPKMIADARHIAVATVNGVDTLVSWNFKHILNFLRVRGYNAINVREGYQPLEIRTPKGVENDAE
ncbi:MAG TPA: PIN domain-containing protein [Longimicrobium sp.]|jgi:predicted nucleic acid-binding protein|nr:PIN domain-containing protein [Longimicrobium sp.]